MAGETVMATVYIAASPSFPDPFCPTALKCSYLTQQLIVRWPINISTFLSIAITDNVLWDLPWLANCYFLPVIVLTEPAVHPLMLGGAQLLFILPLPKHSVPPSLPKSPPLTFPISPSASDRTSGGVTSYLPSQAYLSPSSWCCYSFGRNTFRISQIWFHRWPFHAHYIGIWLPFCGIKLYL